MQPLEQYSSALSQQQKDQLFTDNFNSLNQTLQFIGVSVIAQQFVAGQSSVGSKLANTQFVGNFQSSGGLIVFLGNFAVEMNVLTTDGSSVTLALLIDGKQVAQAFVELAPNAANVLQVQMVPLFFCGSYTAGNHSVVVQASNSGNGLAAIGTSVATGYYILEARNP